MQAYLYPPLVRLLPLGIWMLFGGGNLPAETPVADTGLQSLIGQNDLTGWKGSLADWKVIDGELIGQADGTLKSNRFIVADIEPTKNFEFEVEVWISAGGNSGLQYRSRSREDISPFAMSGYQCDVVSNRNDYNGMLYEEKGRRILAHRGERVIIDKAGQPWVTGKLPMEPAFAPEQWHRYRVRVEANHHRHWIDDVLTVDVIDLDEQGRSLEGAIGVQVHVGPPMTVKYRNFQLKRLPDDLPVILPTDASIPDDAVQVVPQGGKRKK